MSNRGIGERLKEERQKIGLDLETLSKRTRIKKRYLLAIERGELSSLPARPMVRGFLKLYLKSLGLSEEFLLDFEDEIKQAENSFEKKVIIKPVKKRKTEDLFKSFYKKISKKDAKRLLPLFFVIMALFAAAIAFKSSKKAPSQKIVKTPVKIKEISKKSKESLHKNLSEHTLILRAKELSWVRVWTDKEVHTYFLKPGREIKFSGKSFRVRIGNAIGIDVFFDGKEVPFQKKRGKVVDLTL